MLAEQDGHFTVGTAAAGAIRVPRRGSRRIRITAMIQTPTIKRIQLTNPMIPAMITSDRKPLNPDRSPENGLLELFPPLPPWLPLPLFPLFPPLFAGLTWRFWVGLTAKARFVSETLTETLKPPVWDGVHEKLDPVLPPHPAGRPE